MVIPNFLSEEQLDGLRADVDKVRSRGKFAVAKIGQDSTNMLNTNIRVAETCFLGPSKLLDVPNPVREQLYDILDGVRRELVSHASTSSTTTATTAVELDSSLTELLYAYYPKGGFYRRHRDAVPGSASTLRKYSLLLYLNQDWDVRTDGGCLRLHFDSGGDELPPGEEPSFLDVSPVGGTLVLFQSDAIPHEVLDTLDRDRLAVVGWYNRPVRISDAVELSSGSGGAPLRLIMLAVALALVTGGVVSLVS